MDTRYALRGIAMLFAAFVCTIAATAGPPLAPKPALGNDPNFTAVSPTAQDGSGNDRGVYLPPLAGPSGEIVGTVLADEGSGPVAFYVGTVDGNGATRFWKGVTDHSGRFHLRLPAVAAGVATLLVFKRFDAHGQPDRGASSIISGTPPHLPDSQPVIGYPQGGPAIVEASTSYQRGGFAQGIVQLRTRGVDPERARVLLDGSQSSVDTLAASDISIVGKLHDTAPLGRHMFSVQSGEHRTNGVSSDIIAVSFTPLAPLKQGEVQPLGMRVEGVGRDPAVARFDVTGAATLADGSTTTTVPLVDGQAQVAIRGERPGQLQIRVTIEVQTPLVAANAETETHPSVLPTTTSRPVGVHYTPPPVTPAPKYSAPRTEGRETPPPLLTTGAPGSQPPSTSRPTASPTPTEYPPPSPSPSATPTPQPCTVKITDGWMEPMQGVWQDDPTFDDHPTKQITRTSKPGDAPVYDAELDMIVDRDSLLFGVEHYRYQGAKVSAGTHSIIHMAGTTDCSDPPKPVKMRFSLEQGMFGKTLWTSDVVSEIKLTGHKAAEDTWEADLVAHGDGIPPPSVGPFVFDSQGDYVLKDELIEEDGTPTGLILTVGGRAHLVKPIKIAYIPLILTPVSADQAQALTAASDALGTEAGKYIPDYYPVFPHWIEGWAYDALDLSNTNVLNPTIEKVTWPGIQQKDIDFHNQYKREDKVNAELARRFAVLARESGYDRFVVTVSPADMVTIKGSDTLGAAVDKKFVYVMQGQSYLTEAHELAHTLPYLWSSIQMNKQCKQPGDYHNKAVLWANGYRIDTNNAPGPRVEEMRQYPFFGVTSPQGSVWIDQCTYWNLARTLVAEPDPAAMLVRGVAFKSADTKKFGGFLWPSYDMTGVPELVARPALPGERWSIVVRSASGAQIAAYPFDPEFADENGRVRDLVAFSYLIPFSADARSVVLRGPDALSWVQQITAHPPSVRISAPAADARLGPVSRVTVRWSATGETDTPLLATVLYSPDGHRWYDQVFEQPVHSVDIALKRSQRHYIKVIVTDGSRSAQAALDFTTTGR
ncbi:MAG: hypothetical protein JO219_12685 [Candidatus Eremiobacteraeota bacterium]|nr:hypothetical protein [Candidatus Eremiobacteraeota bacterium]